jgi:predicted RNA binding protein YcfA (HicA-like mRNA interferase family)
MLQWSKRGNKMQKEFRELKSMLEKSGFILIKDGNHCLFSKNGKTVTVTKNVRDPKRLFKKILGQAENR